MLVVAAEVVAEAVVVVAVDQTASAIRSTVAVSVMTVNVHAPVEATANERRMLQTRWISRVSILPKPELRPRLDVHHCRWMETVFKLNGLISLKTMIVYYVILLCWCVAVFPANSNVFHFVQRFVIIFFQSLYTFSAAAVLETSVIWCVCMKCSSCTYCRVCMQSCRLSTSNC